MDHSEISELISAYLDGEATPAEREHVERLLETSPPWRSKLDQFSRLSELVRDLPREAAPPELAETVQQRVAQKSAVQPVTMPTRSLRREWLAAFAGMAVTVMAGLIGLQLMPRSQAPDGEFSAMRKMALTLPQQQDFSANGALPESASSSLSALPMDASTTAVSEEGRTAGGAAFSAPATSPVTNFRMGSTLSSREAASSKDAAPTDAPAASMFYANRGLEELESEGVAQAWHDWDKVRLGDVLTVFEQTNGVVAVVELDVVDIKEAGGQLELVLARHGLKVFSDTPQDAANDGKPADAVYYDRFDVDAKQQEQLPQLNMVYVTAPSATISQVLDELGRQQVVAQAKLQPPVPTTQVADLAADEPTAADDVRDERNSTELMEESLMNEAYVVGQNYTLTQSLTNTASEALDRSMASKGTGTADVDTNLQKRPERIKERMKQSRSVADSKSKAVADRSLTQLSVAKSSQAGIALSNTAVTFNLNPETGEVTNQLRSLNQSRKFDTAAGKKIAKLNELPVESKMVRQQSKDQSGEAAPAKKIGEPDADLDAEPAEPSIRVLFVVKQAPSPVAP